MVAFLIGYTIVGFMTELRPPLKERELIPFFSWFLFHETPKEVSRFALVLYEYNEQMITPPRLWNDVPGIQNPFSLQLYALIQRWGQSVLDGDIAASDRWQRIFEESFLYHQARYELVEIRYDPIERWRNGRFTIERRLVSRSATAGQTQ